LEIGRSPLCGLVVRNRVFENARFRVMVSQLSADLVWAFVLFPEQTYLSRLLLSNPTKMLRVAYSSPSLNGGAESRAVGVMVHLAGSIRMACSAAAGLVFFVLPLTAQEARNSRQSRTALQIQVRVDPVLSVNTAGRQPASSPVVFNLTATDRVTSVREEAPYHPPVSKLPKEVIGKPAVLRTVTYVPD
jgi:hypothetical protein